MTEKAIGTPLQESPGGPNPLAILVRVGNMSTSLCFRFWDEADSRISGPFVLRTSLRRPCKCPSPEPVAHTGCANSSVSRGRAFSVPISRPMTQKFIFPERWYQGRRWSNREP